MHFPELPPFHMSDRPHPLEKSGTLSLHRLILVHISSPICLALHTGYMRVTPEVSTPMDRYACS